MYRLNLFHEQQQLQRARDLDPVRLTILGGLLVALLIAVYAVLLYIRMGDLRSDLESRRKELAQVEAHLKGLGPRTDLARIQGQAQLLQERMERRTPIATQLDLLRDMVMTNCQVRLFKFQRGLQITETTVEGRKGPIVIKKVAPTLTMTVEIESRGKDKVEVLQTRDRQIEEFRNAARLKEWAVQTAVEGSSNSLNHVDLVSSQTPDAARGVAMGIFEFRVPFVVKESPREIP